LSTSHPKTSLTVIFKYGREALQNRRKDLFFISIVFLVAPQLVAFLAWGGASSQAVKALATLEGLSPRLQLEAVYNLISTKVILASLFAGCMGMIGVLALARSCVDYFESRPETLRDVVVRAVRVFLKKGIGCFVLMAMVFPTLVLLPLLRAVAMSMLVMLPVTLVAGPSGGFKTGWDTLFLKYANHSASGRWPVFVTVLSVTGVFLTSLFGVAMLIELIGIADTLVEIPAGLLATTIHLGGISINSGLALSGILGLLWECLAIAVILPFTAAIYHLSTVPVGHVPFETAI
jgi:hypothetical protein